MKLSIQEQLQRLEESTEARMKSRARKREQHALEENPMYRKGKGMGDFGKGVGDGGGKGKGGGGGGGGGVSETWHYLLPTLDFGTLPADLAVIRGDAGSSGVDLDPV